MSLFQERARSSKRIISLENEIIRLKAELNKKQEVDTSVFEKRESELLEEIAALKAEVKNAKSETTRTKNKLLKLQNSIENKDV